MVKEGILFISKPLNLRIFNGKVKTPLSEAKVQTQKADLPGNKEEGDYALFKFNEGLSY